MKQIPVPGGSIAVVDEGAGAGTPILFVHGFPLTHAMWQSQIQALAASHRVVAPDLRGFGESRWTPERSDEALTMEAFADDLHALLAALSVKGPVIFCGLSMGGYVGWQFFRKYRSQVKALIQCDTRAAADKPEAADGRYKLAEQVLAAGPEAARDAMLPRLVSPKTQKDRPDLVAAVRDMILKNTPTGLAAGLRGLAERPDCTNLLAQIDVPTLLVCGRDDQITPSAEMRGLSQQIPGARFIDIPDAGHMAPLENPQAVNAAIQQFLNDVG